LSSDGDDGRRETEDSLVGTVKLILKFFTGNGGGTLESEDSRVRTDLKGDDFTGIWSNTNGVIGLLFIRGDGSGQGNLDVSEWNSGGSNNNWN
jgi:hypothetical protein